MKTLLVIVMLSCALTSWAADDLVKPLEVRKVFINGKHNAFTAMRRFKGELYLAFRAGDARNSPTADVLVLKSKDGTTWSEPIKICEPQFILWKPCLHNGDCEMPAGGDYACLEAVEDGPNMLVSYYSTHEGTTDVYLAVVPL